MKRLKVFAACLSVGSVGSAGAGCTGTNGGNTVDGAVTTDAAAVCDDEDGDQARVACAANAVIDTLDDAEAAAVVKDLDDVDARTLWSNLPVDLKPRAGAQLSSLDADSQAAVLDLVRIALSEQGRTTATGVLRGDDYLSQSASGYGSGLYSIAIFGTPSATEPFAVMFGGHHMAYNLSFNESGFSPAPAHLGCEPKEEFTIDGGTYAPLQPLGDSMFAVVDALDDDQKATAYLSGQVFNDVVVSPDLDYGKGSDRTSTSAFPTGANRTGVNVASLSADQQALVIAAIETIIRQYPEDVADVLMDDYTSESALADTLFAWGGESGGPDREVSGSYLRIDGPRLWIELAVQGGIVFRDQTHYHSIYHDKEYDYGGEL